MSGGISGRLTDKAIRAFIGKEARGSRISDGGGLYLFITSPKNASWRIKYRINGKEKVYTIGIYPLVSLAVARVTLIEVKSLIRENKDPVTQRRISRSEASAASGNTFESVADDWLIMKKQQWSEVHYIKSSRAFKRDIYPVFGKLPIASITPSIVAKVIEDIHKRGALETATRILQHLNGVFRYAQAKGLCGVNPASSASEILPNKKIGGRMPALLDFASLGDILRRANMANISPSVRMAHRLCAFTAARIGNVVSAEWNEFNFKDIQPFWNIPRIKMKVKSRLSEHRIPLSPEIENELREWKNTYGGKGYVFPSPTGGKHIGRESIEKMYRVTLRLEGKHSPHGWRSSFSTLARDHGFSRDVVELALDHIHDNEVARAYDRGERLIERIKLFKWWGEQLAAAQRGAKIISLKTKSTR